MSAFSFFHLLAHLGEGHDRVFLLLDVHGVDLLLGEVDDLARRVG